MGKYIAAVEDYLVLPARVSLSPGSKRLLRQAGQLIPAPVPVRLLIDTGAKRTTLIPGILRHVNPPGGDLVRVATPLSVGTTRLFWVQLDFPQARLASFDVVRVASLAMPPELAQFHGLLGRDLLRRLASFLYEGQRGRYTLRDAPGILGWLQRWL